MYRMNNVNQRENNVPIGRTYRKKMMNKDLKSWPYDGGQWPLPMKLLRPERVQTSKLYTLEYRLEIHTHTGDRAHTHNLRF